jgi:hypothetical protein
MVDLRSAQMMYNALFMAQLQFSFPRLLFSSKTHTSLSFQRIPQEKQIVRTPCLLLARCCLFFSFAAIHRQAQQITLVIITHRSSKRFSSNECFTSGNISNKD